MSISSKMKVSLFTVFLLISVLMTFEHCSDKQGPPPADGLYLPDDLEVTLWAESPLFFNPTNMDVDLQGRIWIAEAVNYRNFNNDSTRALHHSKGDRIMILEDTDHDGKADTSKVFVQDKDLVSPLGIAVIDNKVIVSCSPHLVIYTDADRNDVPDKKEIFLTGFGGLDHDHSLHAVVCGPDGRWYFNTGNAGPHIVKDKRGWTLRSGSIYTGGSPYNKANQGNLKSDDGNVWVGGLALRINPDGSGLKVMGHNFRNSYESAIDSYGNLWQNDNDDQVVACRTSWLMEGGNAGYFSTDGTRFWQADQRPWQDVFTAHWHQDDPGVMPAGDKSGAGAPTGIVRYEGDALGEKYRGMLFSADAGRNVIFGYKPEPYLSGYDLGKRSNFLTSLPTDNEGYVWNDTSQNTDQSKWFRPSDIVAGTDGSLYVADWYDPVVGGHQMQDSLGYGRIYRINRKGTNPKAPVFNLRSTKGLITALRNPAIHVRTLAAGLLVAKGDEAIKPVLGLLKSNNRFEKARAVWILSKLGKKGQAEVVRLLGDNDPEIRGIAIRALRQSGTDILSYAERLSRDPSDYVRRELVLALKDKPFNQIKPILIVLSTTMDGRDKWYGNAWADACKGHEDEMFDALVKGRVIDSDPSKWTEGHSTLVFALHPPAAVPLLRKRVTADNLNDSERSKAITALAFINTTASVDAMLALAASPLRPVSEQAIYWLAFRQSNDWLALTDWSKMNLDTERERNLAMMRVKRNKVLDPQLPFDEKKWNIQDMARDATGGQMIVAMVSDSLLPRNLYPFVEELIFKNPAMDVRIQASAIFKKPGRNYSIPAIMELKPDIDSGRILFLKNCTPCHRLNQAGSDIAPDLTLINKKLGRRALLDAIIHPSGGIVFGYEPWLIITKGGEAHYGFLVADGEKTLVIKDLAGRKHIISAPDVKSRKKQDNSLMPEPSSFGFSEQDLANLSSYLMSQ